MRSPEKPPPNHLFVALFTSLMLIGFLTDSDAGHQSSRYLLVIITDTKEPPIIDGRIGDCDCLD